MRVSIKPLWWAGVRALGGVHAVPRVYMVPPGCIWSPQVHAVPKVSLWSPQGAHGPHHPSQPSLGG